MRCPRDRLDLWAVPDRRPHRCTKSSRCTPSGTRDYMRRPPSRFGGQKDAGGPGPPAAQVPPCFDVYRRRSCSPPRSIITAATLRQTATPHTSVNNEIHMASLSDFLRPPLERRKQLPKGGSVPSLVGKITPFSWVPRPGGSCKLCLRGSAHRNADNRDLTTLTSPDRCATIRQRPSCLLGWGRCAGTCLRVHSPDLRTAARAAPVTR